MLPNELLGVLLKEAGAVKWGVAEAGPVDGEEWSLFERWLARGWHAGMQYMERYPEIRRDPRLLLDGARSIISVAFNYRQHNPFRGLATYALGRDYHKVLRRRLKPVVSRMKEIYGGGWRVCIDSAPVLERYWAVRAGVGHRSPVHGNIVVPGVGSMVFLAEIVTTLVLPPSSESRSPEGYYARGICPSGALHPGGVVDAGQCINYLTIEHRGALSERERRLTAGVVFGCDKCQLSCPENQGEAPDVLPEFRPLPGLAEFLCGAPSDFDLDASPIKRKFRL